MDYIDKILNNLHTEAANDSHDGQQTDAKDDNDKIGRIHDMLSEMYNDYKLKKDSKKEGEEAKEESKEELKEVEDDRKEDNKNE